MHDYGQMDLRLVASRFRGVAEEWALEDGDVAGLLGIPATALPAAVGEGAGLSIASETRMRHAIDVAGTARRLLDRDEPSDLWIRAPNPALFGRSPLEVMIAVPQGLAAIRHRLMSEVADGCS